THRPRPTSPPLPYTTLFRSWFIPNTSLAIPPPLSQAAHSCRSSCRYSATCTGGGNPPFTAVRTTWRLSSSHAVEGAELYCRWRLDRKSTRLNSSHVEISYAV